MEVFDDIRDGFVDTCDKLRSTAHGYQYVADNIVLDAVDRQEGERAEIESAIAGFEEFWEKQFSGWRSSMEDYLENLNMPLELFHAYLVQAWYGFLDNVFERMLEEHFAGRAVYEMASIPVQFKPSDDTPNSLADNILTRAAEHFANRTTPDEKLRLLVKARKVDLPDKLTLSIRKHVVVRNVCQHNRGTLRPRDLVRLPGDDFMYPCIEGAEQGDYYNPGQTRDYRMRVYGVGDTVTIDGMVLDQVYYDCIEAARLLTT